jgi:hypothetical protein
MITLILLKVETSRMYHTMGLINYNAFDLQKRSLYLKIDNYYYRIISNIS